MLLLLQRVALQDELHEIVIALVVGSLGLWGGGTPSHQAHILDLVAQAVLHHRIAPIDESRNQEVIPDQKATIPSVGVELKRRPTSLRLPCTLSIPRPRLLKRTRLAFPTQTRLTA